MKIKIFLSFKYSYKGKKLVIKMIDAHIHLDKYTDEEIRRFNTDFPIVDSVISVSNDLESCRRNINLSLLFKKVNSAFGYHPEQQLPTDKQKAELFEWMISHHKEMIAIGEVGLPYYLRQNGEISAEQYGEYIELLESFVKISKQLGKPIALHAVYDDAPVVCDLLEKHSISKAHFHWYKGDKKTTERMIQNGYLISITPEIVYKDKIKRLASVYPLEKMMIETDGPWPFEGPFEGTRTHPFMMQESIKKMAEIKKLSIEEVANTLYQNTLEFYELKL